MQWKYGVPAVLVAMVVGLVATQTPSMGQDAQREGREGREGRERSERRQFDPEQMRERMSQMMKERMGASDEEWAVISPRLQKVVELQRADRGGRGAMMMGFRGRGGGEARAEQGPQRGEGRRGGAQRQGRGGGQEAGPVAQKARALTEVLGQEDAQPEQIRQALTELREARQKQAQELETARQELREVLSLRQEAQLVVVGVLE